MQQLLQITLPFSLTCLFDLINGEKNSGRVEDVCQGGGPGSPQSGHGASMPVGEEQEA